MEWRMALISCFPLWGGGPCPLGFIKHNEKTDLVLNYLTYGPPIQTVHVMQWGQRNTTLVIRGIKVKWMLWGNTRLGKTARQSHPIALHVLCSSLWGGGDVGGKLRRENKDCQSKTSPDTYSTHWWRKRGRKWPLDFDSVTKGASFHNVMGH